MLKQEKSNIKTYSFKFGFMIDIVDNKTTWDVWLYHKDVCAKNFLFGLYKKYFDNYDNFLECVENNLLNESYISDYIDEYKD